MPLKGKTALVTGGGSGIGRACAQRLARAGAAVAIADLNAESAKEAAQEIGDLGGTAMAIAMDVSSEEAVISGFAQCASRLGGVDLLVSNAGIQIVHPIEEFPLAQWQQMLRIHADGAFLTSREAFRQMKAGKKGGKIIFMGSVHSHEGSRLKSPYCFAKHGLLGLCRVLAKEGAEHGIFTYTVCPGFVRTALVEKQIPQQAATLGISEEEVVRNVMLRDTVDGCFTTLDDVAAAVAFLAQDSGALTGQSINLTHGWSMK